MYLVEFNFSIHIIFLNAIGVLLSQRWLNWTLSFNKLGAPDNP